MIYVSHAAHQTLRVLEGRFVLERMDPDTTPVADGDVLAAVFGPDGGARMRREDGAAESWAALWNGDAAHPPDATGMCAAIVTPLADGGVPVWVAASFDGDIVMVPSGRLAEATRLLQLAGHKVIG